MSDSLREELTIIVKKLVKHSRALTLKETKILKKIRAIRESELERGFKVRQIITAVVLGIVSLYLAVWTVYDLITFILGTLALFCFAYLIIQPYETYKSRKKATSIINKVNAILNSGAIEVTPFSANRVALAKAYKDEGDLYIIETDNNDILYMRDLAGSLKKNFPSLHFEIYSDEFFELIGRQINPLSEKIKPIEIPPKAKWNYLKKVTPGHLAIEKKDFDKLLEKINSLA